MQLLLQFERFRRIFHHTTYRVLLNHDERKVLSSFYMNEVCKRYHGMRSGDAVDIYGHQDFCKRLDGRFRCKLLNQLVGFELLVLQHCFKQRVWVSGVRPGEEGIFEFSLEQVRHPGVLDGVQVAGIGLHR